MARRSKRSVPARGRTRAKAPNRPASDPVKAFLDRLIASFNPVPRRPRRISVLNPAATIPKTIRQVARGIAATSTTKTPTKRSSRNVTRKPGPRMDAPTHSSEDRVFSRVVSPTPRTKTPRPRSEASRPGPLKNAMHEPVSSPRREPGAHCKERPRFNKSKGGGSRPFIPWCNRRR